MKNLVSGDLIDAGLDCDDYRANQIREILESSDGTEFSSGPIVFEGYGEGCFNLKLRVWASGFARQDLNLTLRYAADVAGHGTVNHCSDSQRATPQHCPQGDLVLIGVRNFVQGFEQFISITTVIFGPVWSERSEHVMKVAGDASIRTFRTGKALIEVMFGLGKGEVGIFWKLGADSATGGMGGMVQSVFKVVDNPICRAPHLVSGLLNVNSAKDDTACQRVRIRNNSAWAVAQESSDCGVELLDFTYSPPQGVI